MHVINFLSESEGLPTGRDVGHLARHHEDVTILFMDIVGFTSMSKQLPPHQVMAFLNR